MEHASSYRVLLLACTLHVSANQAKFMVASFTRRYSYPTIAFSSGVRRLLRSFTTEMPQLSFAGQIYVLHEPAEEDSL